MLEIQSLTKRFGALDVLRGVDLTVAPGRVTALVGPNGAGKTTLIKSVLGLTRPDGGTIRLNGAPARGDAYRAAIGYMPQIARFPDNLSAAELITMLVDLRGRDAGERDEDLVERFALAPHLAKPLRALSGGTRQKVNAVLAFLFRPSLLILDEPTEGIQPNIVHEIGDIIMRLNQEGLSVLLVEQKLPFARRVADSFCIMDRGRRVATGRMIDLTDALVRQHLVV